MKSYNEFDSLPFTDFNCDGKWAVDWAEWIFPLLKSSSSQYLTQKYYSPQDPSKYVSERSEQHTTESVVWWTLLFKLIFSYSINEVYI